jgi:hypothetical protein
MSSSKYKTKKPKTNLGNIIAIDARHEFNGVQQKQFNMIKKQLKVKDIIT